ncbi:hypothetical protein BH11CYA1_BH11CYA1_28680 [soil metagenome]
MNIDELAQNLIKITARLPEGQAEQVRQFISATRTKTLGLVVHPIKQDSANTNEECIEGRIGGQPLLPPYFKWPDDRYGQSMIFLAQFDLAKLPSVREDAPKAGLLTLFRSDKATSLNSKDRKGFHIQCLPESDRKNLMATEQPENVELPAFSFKSGLTYTVARDLDELKKTVTIPFDMQADIENWISSFNSLSKCQSQLYGTNVSGFNQLQETCAFAFNGISYNSARASDSHYSHLVKEAPDWILLSRISESELFGQNHGVQESLVLIRDQDLKEGQFDRAWMIVRPLSAPSRRSQG